MLRSGSLGHHGLPVSTGQRYGSVWFDPGNPPRIVHGPFSRLFALLPARAPPRWIPIPHETAAYGHNRTVLRWALKGLVISAASGKVSGQIGKGPYPASIKGVVRNQQAIRTPEEGSLY
jgi:hypothetical protein